MKTIRVLSSRAQIREIVSPGFDVKMGSQPIGVSKCVL